MVKFFLIIIAIVVIFWCINNKIHIKFRTFFKRGFAPKRGQFGLYVYDGAQGKGKTYSLIEYLLDNRHSIECFSNIKGIKNLDYAYYTGFDGLIDIKHKLDNGTLVYDPDKQLVIVYDEIFTELQKHSKLNKEVIDFLCQMRKRKIIFLTTAQYWAEIPLSFRRFCRYEIQCNMINFLGIGILIKRFGDAEQMKWDEEQQEHVCPLNETTITHCRRFIANSYDTYLRISSVAPKSDELEIHEVSSEPIITNVETNNVVCDRDQYNEGEDNNINHIYVIPTETNTTREVFSDLFINERAQYNERDNEQIPLSTEPNTTKEIKKETNVCDRDQYNEGEDVVSLDFDFWGEDFIVDLDFEKSVDN